MSNFPERETTINEIKQDPQTKKVIATILENFGLEIVFFPEYDTLYEDIQIAIFNEKETSFAKRLETANRLQITFLKLLTLYENGELPDYLYGLAMKQIVEKPSDTAIKFMEIFNKKQTEK